MIGYLIGTWDLLAVLPMDGNIAIWLISTLVTMVQKILPQVTNLVSFPAYSVAWNIAEEPIIKKNLKWMNMFKLRYSYGKVGSDNIGTRFPYLELFESRNPYNWGRLQYS